jgi:hypothetical protein
MNQPSLFANLDRRLRAETVDICAGRHKQNSASVAANPSAEQKSKDCALVLSVIKQQGKTWSKQIGRILNREIHTFSGRLTWLKVNGYIVKAQDEKVEGCEVFRWTGK